MSYGPSCAELLRENARLKEESSRLQSVLRLAKRVVNEVEYERAENMNSLKIRDAERLLILEALDRTGGDRTLAAKLLGVARSTFFDKLKRHHIRDAASRPVRACLARKD
jgi:transcriptional regulator of acetoin/glycerol metabolism